MSKGVAQTQDSRYVQPIQFGLAGLLFMLAIAAIVIGTLLIALGSMSNSGNVSRGAVILIGPIPIIIGAGPYAFELVELAVVLTIVAIILFLLVTRRGK
jgi:uncharacterized membrane protein